MVCLATYKALRLQSFEQVAAVLLSHCVWCVSGCYQSEPRDTSSVSFVSRREREKEDKEGVESERERGRWKQRKRPPA